MFTYGVAKAPEISEQRDQCVMEEIAKAKMLIEGLAKNLNETAPENVDVVKATKALRTLEERVEVLKHIKNPPFKQDSSNLLEF